METPRLQTQTQGWSCREEQLCSAVGTQDRRGRGGPEPGLAPGQRDAGPRAGHAPRPRTHAAPRGGAYRGFELQEGDGGAVEELRGQPALFPAAVSHGVA